MILVKRFQNRCNVADKWARTSFGVFKQFSQKPVAARFVNNGVKVEVRFGVFHQVVLLNRSLLFFQNRFHAPEVCTADSFGCQAGRHPFEDTPHGIQVAGHFERHLNHANPLAVFMGDETLLFKVLESLPHGGTTHRQFFCQTLNVNPFSRRKSIGSDHFTQSLFSLLFQG